MTQQQESALTKSSWTCAVHSLNADPAAEHQAAICEHQGRAQTVQRSYIP